MSEGGSEDETLEYTPTWVVAGVCTVIVAISLGVERLLHFLGHYLKRKHKKPLFEALQKVKEGFFMLQSSLLLVHFVTFFAFKYIQLTTYYYHFVKEESGFMLLLVWHTIFVGVVCVI